MRLSNRNKAPVYNFALSLLNIFLAIGIIAFLAEIFRFNILGNEQYFLIIIPLILLVIFYLRGKQIFEYDSDGEAINFKNRSTVPFLDRAVSDEFPKYKVISYEIADFIIVKRLYVSINSKKNVSINLKYDISYLTKREISDLRISLNKVVKNNNEKVNS